MVKYTHPNQDEILSNWLNNPKFHFELYAYNGPPHFHNNLIKSGSYEGAEQKLISFFTNEKDIVLELGANIGNSTILFTKILANPENQLVTFEPNSSVVEVLKKNRDYHKTNFKIYEGILSKNKDMYFTGDGWSGKIVKFKTNKKVKCFDFDEINKNYNFTLLFADVEGSLWNIIQDFPNIAKNLRIAIIEKDGHPVEPVHKYFLENNMELIFDWKLHSVYKKSTN